MNRICSVMIICVLLLALVGCNKSAKTEQVDDRESMEISTEYGTLLYPVQWKDKIKTEQNKKGDVIHISFTTKVKGKSYPLFIINIGSKGEGTEVGEIKDDAQKSRPVYVVFEELPEMKDLTEAQKDDVFSMQEDLNYLIDHLE